MVNYYEEIDNALCRFAQGWGGVRPEDHVVERAYQLIEAVVAQSPDYSDSGVVCDGDVYELYIRVRFPGGFLLEGTVEMDGTMEVGYYDQDLNVLRRGQVSNETDVWALARGEAVGMMLDGV